MPRKEAKRRTPAAERNLEFREKFGFYKRVASTPERIRNGSIYELIKELAENNGKPPKKYERWFEDFARTILHEHPALDGKQSSTDDEAIYSTLIESGGVQKNVLKKAMSHHFNERIAPTFTPGHIERMSEMIDYLYENRQKIRKDALEGFRESWNKNKLKKEHVSYEALKGDLIALSYAYLPMGRREAEEKHVVKDHVKNFKKALALKHRGLLSYTKARKVCGAFTQHSIKSDLERLRRETLMIDNPSYEEQLNEIYSQFSEALKEIYRLRKSEPNVHRVTAAATAWSEMGWPLHEAVPSVNKKVYSLFELAEAKQQGENPQPEDYGFPGITAGDKLLEHIETVYGIYPRIKNEPIEKYESRKREKAAQEITRVWNMHLEHTLATLEYERGRHALKGKKLFHGFISWGDPLRFDAPDREMKNIIKKNRGPLLQEAKSHFKKADKHWKSYKQKLEKNPFL